jgi:predicted transcriptional regulator
VRGITLFIFGGVSQITREPPTAGSEFRIAIAGPLTSVALGLVFSLLGALLASMPPLAAPAVYLGRINVFLGLFNLLPGFPLDGGRLLRALIWARGATFRTATRWASYAGHGLAFLFVLAGVGELLGGRVLDGLWIAFLGWFLNNAAEASYQQVVLDDVLRGVTARDLASSEWPAVRDDVPLDQLVHDYILLRGEPWLYVGRDGVAEGVITLKNVNAVPRERWAAVTAEQAMTPIGTVPHARPEDGVLALLRRMDEAGVEQLPLVDGNRLVGTVSRERLLRYIRTHSEVRV